MNDFRKGRVVVASLESADGTRCVDIFSKDETGYRFDEWRRDPEDPSGWHFTGVRSTHEFETAEAASQAARNAVDWLD